MAMNDPIADFLTRIRNASSAQHRFVDADWSKMRQSIAEILKKYGFIDSYLVTKETECRGKIRLFLKYSMGRHPVIQGVKRISTPGLRRYVRHDQIPVFFGGLGIPILSTSQGILPGSEAKKRQVGGELLCLVW